MTILIDADACPQIEEIIQLAQIYNVKIRIYCDYAHNINSEYATIIQVDQGFQNVDIKIINEIEKLDILITQDYGLAALALNKQAIVLDTKGNIFQQHNIDYLLEQREFKRKLRSQKIHIKGPKKRTQQDKQFLLENLEKQILLWYNDKGQ